METIALIFQVLNSSMLAALLYLAILNMERRKQREG